MICVVIPSNRGEKLEEFFNAWNELENEQTILLQACKIIIIEDNEKKTFPTGWADYHYSWAEINEDLKDDSWIISRRDSAIRSYGFLVAHRLGADVTITLDDDCHPYDVDFVSGHLKQLEQTPAWCELIPGMRTRGLPYKNKGELSNVVANVGLWTENPDYDAVQTLSNGDVSGFMPPDINRIMPASQYFPMTGMNVAFKRLIAPLMLFAPMGDNQPYRRFDDIWCGIILKKICDHLGYAISCGHPFVHHSRASDPFVNLVKEAPGIQFNEIFWSIIDGIPLAGNTPKICMEGVGAHLQNSDDKYLQNYGRAITTWVKYF